MRQKLRYLGSTAIMMALPAIGGSPAWAQIAAPAQSSLAAPGPGKIEEIVVTARRRAELLQKVPVAVTALTSRDIKNQAIQTLTDLPAQTPSLTIATNNADPSASTVSLRGQVQNDVIPAVEPSVGIYVDDVYFGQTVGTALAHVFDVSRIEVLKGPQGTLYGRNTTGGAVKLYTNDPVDEYHATLQLGLGDYDRANGAIMANFPIIPGVLDLRVVGQAYTHSGYGTNLSTGKGLDDEDSRSGRFALKFTPNDDWDVILRGEFNRGDFGGTIYKPLYVNPELPPASAAGLDAAIEKYGLAALGLGIPGATAEGVRLYQQQIGGNPFDVDYNAEPDSNATIYGGSLSIAYSLDSLTLRSITSLRQLNETDNLDLDGSSYGILATHQENHQSQETQEFQASGNALDDKLKYQVGLFYFDRQANYISTSTDLLGLAALGAVDNPSYANSVYDKTSPSAYGQAEYAITPTINATAGLRWTSESDHLSNQSLVGATELGPSALCNVPAEYNTNGQCRVNLKHSDRNVSYTFGLDWTPLPDVLLYAKTSRGYKSGGINERVSSAPSSISTFAPEVVEDYEGGIKATWLDGRLRVNADVYHSDYSNYQASVIESDAGNLFTVVQNAKNATIDGSEAEITAIPFDNAALNLTGAWTQPKYNDFTVFNGATTIDEAFRNFLQTPKFTFSVSGAYTIPTGLGPLHLQLDYSWRDSADLQPNDAPGVAGPGTPGTPDSVRIQQSYGLLNAEANFHITKWNADIDFFAKNLTNQRYYVGELGVVSAGVGTAVGIPGDPLTWGVDLTKYF